MSTSKLNLGVAALLGCLLLALPAAAKVEVGGGVITFDVADRSVGYALTVTGPGEYRYSEEFEAGAQMSWSAAGASDGLYKYELVRVAEHRERGEAPAVEAAAAISGAVTVKGGTLVNPDRPEKLTKDVVHLDDVIIDGSACVGFDCVNGENFGFDTLRLKENNLRIHFDDTSNSGTFPANDWRIVANDTSNGGSNYLAIEDSTAGRIPFRVEAGARANALVVEADGDVGIGTLNPAVDLEVVTGNTPTLRLQQDGSSGFTAQTWDVAGNEANFFVRDVTNGSKLSFRIRPGAPESSIDIASNGDVGIGTASPKAPLHVLLGGTSFNFNASTSAGIQNNAASGNGVIFSMIGGNGTGGNSQLAFGDTDSEFQGRIIYDHGALDSFRFFTNGALAMTLNNSTDTNLIDMANGAVLTAGGVWTNASSRELKENISSLSLEEAASALGGLSPVTYNYKVSPGETYVGFIAEDVPELVATADHRGLASMDIVAVLTKVVQEQQKNIESLTQKLQQLEEAITP